MLGNYQDTVAGSGFLTNLNLIGAQVFVYNSGTDVNDSSTWVKAELFSDPMGINAQQNPVTTDGSGNFIFYANVGTYDLRIVMPGHYDRWIYGISVTPSATFVRTVTSSTNIDAFTDYILFINGAGQSGNIVLTLPDVSLVSGGRNYIIERIDDSDPNPTVTITSFDGNSSISMTTQYERINVIYDPTSGDWIY